MLTSVVHLEPQTAKTLWS